MKDFFIEKEHPPLLDGSGEGGGGGEVGVNCLMFSNDRCPHPLCAAVVSITKRVEKNVNISSISFYLFITAREVEKKNRVRM